MHTYIHTHTDIHTYIHACIHTYIHLYTYTHIYTCNMRIYWYKLIYIYMSSIKHIFIRTTSAHLYIYIYIIFIYTCIYLDPCVYIYMYISICIHVCIYIIFQYKHICGWLVLLSMCFGLAVIWHDGPNWIIFFRGWNHQANGLFTT